MDSLFQLVPTPSPTEFMVALTVPDQIINSKLALLPRDNALQKYTPYNKFSWGGSLPRAQEFGEYVYLSSNKNAAESVTFYFGKPKTVKEKNTPFFVKTDTHQYVWPSVLLDLYFISSTFPQSTSESGGQIITAPRYFQRHRYVPSTPANSVVKIEQFLSDTPWTKQDLTHQQPVTAEIDGTFLGLNVTFPRCLHRRVTLKELVPGARIVFGSGMEGSDRNGTPGEQVFPATNFTDWRPFVFADDAKETDQGLFFRERTTIYPPSRSEPIQN